MLSCRALNYLLSILFLLPVTVAFTQTEVENSAAAHTSNFFLVLLWLCLSRLFVFESLRFVRPISMRLFLLLGVLPPIDPCLSLIFGRRWVHISMEPVPRSERCWKRANPKARCCVFFFRLVFCYCCQDMRVTGTGRISTVSVSKSCLYMRAAWRRRGDFTFFEC